MINRLGGFPRHFVSAGHSLALKLRRGLFSFTHCRTKQTAFVSPNTINHIQCKNKNQPQGLVCVFGGNQLALIEQKTNKNFLI